MYTRRKRYFVMSKFKNQFHCNSIPLITCTPIVNFPDLRPPAAVFDLGCCEGGRDVGGAPDTSDWQREIIRRIKLP